ncbi:MAG: FAD-dependent oxidoreductase [Bacteroidota bacterium]
MFSKEYDVIVVGAGHAGAEAAAAAANMGSKTLLITMNLQTIGQMSCNPAMGGIAKGQIVREIDALGGYSGIITDRSAIQFKMLNKSKGPAMWSPRAQSDRMRFAEEWRLALESTPNVDFYQEMVSGILVEQDRVVGIRTSLGIDVRSRSVVLTNGTFLNGLIHIGEKQFGGGRAGEKAATGITEQLSDFGFDSGRMKTGTPPRVDGRSLDYNKMIVQPGDRNPEKFSYLDTPFLEKQRDCHMTHTSALVHDLLREGFDRSPMFNGRIKSIGPRYCPSIEDKINRFADKDSHQIFVELNIRHSQLEMNWHLPVDDQDALELKKFLVRSFDQNDISTYGLTFGISNDAGKRSHFASVIIEKNTPPQIIKDFEVRPTYNVLHFKRFDPNTQQYESYAQDVDKIELPGLLMELSKKYFEQLGHGQVQAPVSKNKEPHDTRTVYQCTSCYTVYDETYGDIKAGIPAGTVFAKIPEEYNCPVCDAPKTKFKQTELQLS